MEFPTGSISSLPRYPRFYLFRGWLLAVNLIWVHLEVSRVLFYQIFWNNCMTCYDMLTYIYPTCTPPQLSLDTLPKGIIMFSSVSNTYPVQLRPWPTVAGYAASFCMRRINGCSVVSRSAAVSLSQGSHCSWRSDFPTTALSQSRSPACDGHIWGSPKMGVPQNGCFIRENPIKMADLGVPQETFIYGHWFCVLPIRQTQNEDI